MTKKFFHPSLLLLFWDPGSGIRDPGWVKIRIRDQGQTSRIRNTALNRRKTSSSATMDAMEKRERGVNAPRSQTALTVSGPVNPPHPPPPPPPANQLKSTTQTEQYGPWINLGHSWAQMALTSLVPFQGPGVSRAPSPPLTQVIHSPL